MHTTTKWIEKMQFVGESEGHSVLLDAKAPIGQGGGLTPKELVAIGIAGCTAMDVVALLKKYKQPLESLEIKSDVEMSTKGHPVIFEKVTLIFEFKGSLEESKVIEAVQLSQTKFCGVSAMIVQATPIHYLIFLNGREIGSGQANFNQ